MAGSMQRERFRFGFEGRDREHERVGQKGKGHGPEGQRREAGKDRPPPADPPTSQNPTSSGKGYSISAIIGSGPQLRREDYSRDDELPSDLPDTDPDEPLLGRDEVLNIIQSWHEKAAEGGFDANIHIVDPAAHYAHLYYLEMTVLEGSEYSRCAGRYDPTDTDYDYGLSRKYKASTISDDSWRQVPRMSTNNKSLTTVSQKASDHLRKSYEILGKTSVLFHFLSKWYFCTTFYSLLIKDPGKDIAKLVPIDQIHLQRLKEAIEFYVKKGFLEKPHSASSIRNIGDICFQLLKEMELQIFEVKPTDVATILVLLRITVLTLDLGLVTYVGSHMSSFDTHFTIAPSRSISRSIEISPQIEGLSRITCSLQQLACVGDFLGGTKVWVFESENHTPADERQDTESHKLSVLTDMETFADVWGPVWPVVEGVGAQARIRQYNLSRGYICPIPLSKSDATEEVTCHWYGPTSTQSQLLKNKMSLRKGDRLLIGGSVKSNEDCPYRLYHFENDCSRKMRPLGTAPTTFQLDTWMIGTNAGQYIVLTTSGTYKRNAGVTLKEHIWNMFKNNPNNVNIELLNLPYGVEISYCTGNARRVRLKDILRLPSVQERLSLYKPGWQTSDWGVEFSDALQNNDFAYMRRLWNREEKRTNIATLIFQTLELLNTTGIRLRSGPAANLPNQLLIAAYFRRNLEDRRVELDVQGNEWARYLRDSDRTATYAVIRDTCLEYSGRLPNVAICDDGGVTSKTVLQTYLRFQKEPLVQGALLRLDHASDLFRVVRIARSNAQVTLSPAVKLESTVQRRQRGAQEVVVTRWEDRERKVYRAIILATKESHRGLRRRRRVRRRVVQREESVEDSMEESVEESVEESPRRERRRRREGGRYPENDEVWVESTIDHHGCCVIL